MNQLSSKRIEMIVNKVTSGQALTLYIPTHQIPTRKNMDEDRLRFKNLLKKGIKKVEDSGNTYFAAFLEKKYRNAMNNSKFWEQTTKSMLITARLGMFEITHLPVDSDEYVSLDDHFHLGPIYGLLYDMQDFYVAHITQAEPKLFKANNYGMSKLEIDLPKNITDALRLDESHQKSVQHHGSKNTQFHGHGAGKDSGDWEEKQFMKVIDQSLRVQIDSALPLVLAGTKHEVALFRSISDIPGITDESVQLNGHRPNHDRLFHRAYKVVQDEVINARREYAVTAFRQTYAKSPSKLLTTAQALQDASNQGRADTVLLAAWKKTTDTVRDNKQQVQKLVMPDTSRKAVDAALEKAWRQGAKVVNVLQSQLPNSGMLSANLRY